MAKEIFVPDIGDFSDVEVIEVLVSEGDTINAEDSLITVESEKAAMEIPAPEAGVIKEMKIKVGDTISEGALMLLLEPAAAGATEAPAAPAEPEAVKEEPKAVAAKATPAAAPQRQSPTAKIDEVSFSKAYASPAIRKFARELGVDLGQVDGSGRKGRIS